MNEDETTTTRVVEDAVERSRNTQGGFNLIEVLMGMAILLLIALFLLPLFSRSALNNLSGRESTQVSKFSRDSQELYSRADFSSADLTVDAGTQKQLEDAWVPHGYNESDPWPQPLQPAGEWVRITGGDPLPAGARWRRVTTVQQHSLSDLNGDPPDDQALDEPLDAGTSENFVHLKWVQVEVEGVRGEGGGLLGPNKRLVVSQLKAF